MNPDRCLLNSLFRLEVEQNITSVWPRHGRSVAGPLEVHHSAISRVLGLFSGHPADHRPCALMVLGGTPERDTQWSATLELSDHLHREAGVIELKGGPSELAFVLAGVTLVREGISGGWLSGELRSIALLNQAIEQPRSSLRRHCTRIGLWAWGESLLLRQVAEADLQGISSSRES